MGVRPPGNSDDDEPDVIEFGIAALDARLEDRDVEFPTSTGELLEDHADLTIPVDAGGTEISLAEALERADRSRFESKTELMDALHPVFEAKRDAVSRSILARLRSLVPF